MLWDHHAEPRENYCASRPYSSSNEVGFVLTRRLPLQLRLGSDMSASFSLTLSSQVG